MNIENHTTNQNESSAALQLLQYLENNGDISPELATELRQKYSKLYEIVSNSIENEESLVKKASELNDKLFETHKQVENKKKIFKNDEKELLELKMTLEKNVIFIQEVETKIDMNIMEKESVSKTNIELQEEIIERRKKSEIMLG
eukprot:187936_1